MKKAVKFLAAVVLTLSVSSTFVSCVEEGPELDLTNVDKSWEPNQFKTEEQQQFRISMFTNYSIVSIKDSKGLELVGTPKVAPQLGNQYDFNKNVITITNNGSIVSKTDYTLKVNPNQFKDFMTDPFELITSSATYKKFSYVPLEQSEKSNSIEYLNSFVRKITFTVSVNNEDLTYILISTQLRS